MLTHPILIGVQIQMTNTVQEETENKCVYCHTELKDFAEAVEHHDEIHSSERFNPGWYSESTDWNKTSLNHIDELKDLYGLD